MTAVIAVTAVTAVTGVRPTAPRRGRRGHRAHRASTRTKTSHETWATTTQPKYLWPIGPAAWPMGPANDSAGLATRRQPASVDLKINRRLTTVSSAAPKPHSRLISRCTEPLVGGTGSGREWSQVMASAALSSRTRSRGSAAGPRASGPEGPFKFQTRSPDTNASEPQSSEAATAGRQRQVETARCAAATDRTTRKTRISGPRARRGPKIGATNGPNLAATRLARSESNVGSGWVSEPAGVNDRTRNMS